MSMSQGSSNQNAESGGSPQLSKDDRLQIYNNAAMNIGNSSGGWGLGSPQSEPYNGPTITNAGISDYWNNVDRYGTGDPSLLDYSKHGAKYVGGQIMDGYNYIDDKATRFGNAQDEAFKKDGSFANVKGGDGFGYNMETAGYLTGMTQRAVAPIISMAEATKDLRTPPPANLVPGASFRSPEDDYIERYYGLSRKKKRRLF